jgi:transcriptional regulator with XRE-family HTH domain
MPHIDQSAKTWEMELSGRIGAAVQARRNALKLTAQQLAERTRALGYLVTRVAISKIETNNRAGKFDVAELLVLAAALDLAPVQLIFPDLVDGPVQVLPNRTVTSANAVAWFAGDGRRLPSEVEPTINPDEGQALDKAWWEAITPLQHARTINKMRFMLNSLTHPQRPTAPDRQEVLAWTEDLEREKSAARHFGLTVDDRFDARHFGLTIYDDRSDGNSADDA